MELSEVTLPRVLQRKKRDKGTHRADCANTTSMRWSAGDTDRGLEKNCKDRRIERLEANNCIDSGAARVCITGMFVSS